MPTRTNKYLRGTSSLAGSTYFDHTYDYDELLALFTLNETIAPAITGYAIQVSYCNYYYNAGSTAFDFPVMSGNWSLGDLCAGLPGKNQMNTTTDHSEQTGRYLDEFNTLDTKEIVFDVSGTPITQGDGTLRVVLMYKYVKLPFDGSSTF